MKKQALMDKAYRRVLADYDILQKEWLGKDKKWLIDHAYEMAHVYEAFYFLEYELTCMPEPDDCRYNEDELNTIINFGHGNVVYAIYDEWLTGNYENEYTNFFCWEHLAEIIADTLFRKESR